ncbi:MAG: lipopolysaccharide heptosyltransferase II [Candidatus Omnitrophica bacterium]|nr:lipopolysaccharide heptosyltransferase II [Candidatus Omnitrophota bacterium]
MERILIVTVNWLGDALMTTPVFKAIKDQFPSSYLGVMVPERVRGVFDDNPFIDEVIVFDEKNNQKGLIAKLRFIKFLKEKKFDTAFLIHRSATKAIICWLSGISLRIGYKRLKNLFFLTKTVSVPQGFLHRQDYYLNLFESQDIVINEKIPTFFIDRKTQQQVDVSLQVLKQKHSLIVGINPSANWKLKRWPAKNFSRLADFLIKKHRAAIIFIGAKDQRSIVDEVIKNMEFKAYDFCGKTSLKELGALIKNSELFISNDSGPAHLAASLGVTTIALFGPTARELTAPRGRKVIIIQKDFDCKIPCYDLNCLNNKCMSNITVEEVAAAAAKQLSCG